MSITCLVPTEAALHRSRSELFRYSGSARAGCAMIRAMCYRWNCRVRRLVVCELALPTADAEPTHSRPTATNGPLAPWPRVVRGCRWTIAGRPWSCASTGPLPSGTGTDTHLSTRDCNLGRSTCETRSARPTTHDRRDLAPIPVEIRALHPPGDIRLNTVADRPVHPRRGLPLPRWNGRVCCGWSG